MEGQVRSGQVRSMHCTWTLQQVLQPQQQTATGAQSAAVGGLGTPQAAFAMPMPPAAAFGFMTASPLMPFASYPAQYAAAYTGLAGWLLIM